MNLWSECYKERFGWETIEVEGGFISYSIRFPSMSLEEIYIRPDMRKSGLGSRLTQQVEKVAAEQNIDMLWAKVQMGNPCTDDTICAGLHYGFKIAGSDGDAIILHKKVEARNG